MNATHRYTHPLNTVKSEMKTFSFTQNVTLNEHLKAIQEVRTIGKAPSTSGTLKTGRVGDHGSSVE